MSCIQRISIEILLQNTLDFSNDIGIYFQRMFSVKTVTRLLALLKNGYAFDEDKLPEDFLSIRFLCYWAIINPLGM